jgi:transcriptional regulator with XRE-family HTH domain
MPNKNWTAESDAAFVHKVAFDFIAQVEKKMKSAGVTQVKLANILGISEGAVSKMLNNPQNLTLKTIAKYSKALGIKAAIVAYDDGDPANSAGLVASEIFAMCWEQFGKPRDVWSVREINLGRSGANSSNFSGLQLFFTQELVGKPQMLSGMIHANNDSSKTLPFGPYFAPYVSGGSSTWPK